MGKKKPLAKNLINNPLICYFLFAIRFKYSSIQSTAASLPFAIRLVPTIFIAQYFKSSNWKIIINWNRVNLVCRWKAFFIILLFKLSCSMNASCTIKFTFKLSWRHQCMKTTRQWAWFFFFRLHFLSEFALTFVTNCNHFFYFVSCWDFVEPVNYVAMCFS